MSAELLQRAANLLREHAEKAQRTEPWCPEYTWAAVRHVQRNVDIECDLHDPDRQAECSSFGRYDGRYVAMMHPPVALALADCMDEAAALGRLGAEFLYRRGMPELVEVAREILREPAVDHA